MLFSKQMEALYRKNVCVRWDETGTVFYFSSTDFPGLHQEPHAFRGAWGQKLQGYFYYYDNPNPGRLVVFDHGMGGGHRSYMKEIERLAKHGFLVFSYDHTGCMESEGENANGMTQSLSDLNACIKELKPLDELKDRTISVMGHSWGGFSTMNIGALHPEISHLVAMSGFISVDQMLKQNFKGILTPFRKKIRKLEEGWNPDFVDTNAVESLKKTDAKVLLIHSLDDETVDATYHWNVLKSELNNQKNIEFLELNGKGHNPNYMPDAVAYKLQFFKAMREKIKNKGLETDEAKRAFVASVDWNRMTAQDNAVWEKILTHLDS